MIVAPHRRHFMLSRAIGQLYSLAASRRSDFGARFSRRPRLHQEDAHRAGEIHDEGRVASGGAGGLAAFAVSIAEAAAQGAEALRDRGTASPAICLSLLLNIALGEPPRNGPGRESRDQVHCASMSARPATIEIGLRMPPSIWILASSHRCTPP